MNNLQERRVFLGLTQPDEIEAHYRSEYARAMSILVRTKSERRFLKKRGRL